MGKNGVSGRGPRAERGPRVQTGVNGEATVRTTEPRVAQACCWTCRLDSAPAMQTGALWSDWKCLPLGEQVEIFPGKQIHSLPVHSTHI